jgi:hypothetical protein
MSSPLAIAAVTAALKDLLNNGLLDHDLSVVGSFSVTATPPDRITTGATEPNQLNLFLYQVTPNLGWRNVGLPARDANGTKLSNPPLALDLHYLLSAYGAQDLNAEILLGYAMQLLHETPFLERQQLRTVLGGTPPVGGDILPKPFRSLKAIDLADQVEIVKITPQFLTTEELSKLWTAMQARYRPTMGYMVTVVLIQARTPVTAAPPVLKRGKDDTGPQSVASAMPILSNIRPSSSQLLPAIRLGGDLLCSGTNLAGVTAVRFENTTLQISQDLVPGPQRTDQQLTVHVPSASDRPDAASIWAVGTYMASLRIGLPGGSSWSTNSVPIALAPSITVSPNQAGAGTTIQLTVTCVPRLRTEQRTSVSLFFGTTEVTPDTITTPDDPTKVTTLTFTIKGATPGSYLVRLRVGGIDSLPIALTGLPPRLDFDPQQKVVVS